MENDLGNLFNRSLAAARSMTPTQRKITLEVFKIILRNKKQEVEWADTKRAAYETAEREVQTSS